MNYSYAAHRPYTMTDEGQRLLFAVLDYARQSKPFGGAVTTFGLFKTPALKCGDTWSWLALIDRLEEMGYLKRVGVGSRPDDKVYIVVEATP